MRRLLCVPIVHSQADLGSVAGILQKAYIRTRSLRSLASAKRLVAGLGTDHGFKPVEIATFLRCSRSAVSKFLARSGQ